MDTVVESKATLKTPGLCGEVGQIAARPVLHRAPHASGRTMS